jgi:hypothetical protein
VNIPGFDSSVTLHSSGKANIPYIFNPTVNEFLGYIGSMVSVIDLYNLYLKSKMIKRA